MKRCLLKLALFLLLGAVVNVAVAWGCAIWTTELGERTTGVPSPHESNPIWNRIARSGWPAAPSGFVNDKRPDGSLTMQSAGRRQSFGATSVDLGVAELELRSGGRSQR